MIPKFRAWDIENKKMYGCYGFDGLNERIYRCNLADAEFRAGHLETIYAVEDDLNNFELMQSTGLKDKNGVEIFEGDVVVGQQHLTTDSSTPFEIKGLVRYSKRNTMFYLDEKSFGHDKFMNSLGSSIYQFEVIGNIYENPELLEVEV